MCAVLCVHLRKSSCSFPFELSRASNGVCERERLHGCLVSERIRDFLLELVGEHLSSEGERSRRKRSRWRIEASAESAQLALSALALVACTRCKVAHSGCRRGIAQSKGGEVEECLEYCRDVACAAHVRDATEAFACEVSFSFCLSKGDRRGGELVTKETVLSELNLCCGLLRGLASCNRETEREKMRTQRRIIDEIIALVAVHICRRGRRRKVEGRREREEIMKEECEWMKEKYGIRKD